MTTHLGHLSRIPTAPVARRSHRTARGVRISRRMLVAVLLEAVVLFLTIELALGIGFEGQLGAPHRWAPDPAPAGAYVLPAPMAPPMLPIAARDQR